MFYFDLSWHRQDMMKATLAMLEMDRKDAAAKARKDKRK